MANDQLPAAAPAAAEGHPLPIALDRSTNMQRDTVQNQAETDRQRLRSNMLRPFDFVGAIGVNHDNPQDASGDSSTEVSYDSVIRHGAWTTDPAMDVYVRR